MTDQSFTIHPSKGKGAELLLDLITGLFTATDHLGNPYDAVHNIPYFEA